MRRRPPRFRCAPGPSAPAALLALLSLLGVSAQFGCSTPPIELLPAAESNPPFYRVESRSGASMVILGSIHVGPPGGWQLPPHVEREFAAAERYVFEVASLDLADAARAMQTHAVLPADRDLEDVLGSELYERLSARLRELGGWLFPLKQFEPWVATMQVVLLEIEAAGFANDDGLDEGLMNRTQPSQRIGLETAEEQILLMDSMSFELQRLQLRATLDDPGENAELFRRMAEAWQRGDDAALTLIVREQDEKYPELAPFMDEMIDQRNRRMAEGLHALLEAGGGHFVTLGAAHVVGPESVPRLLEARGHRVERVVPAYGASRWQRDRRLAARSFSGDSADR